MRFFITRSKRKEVDIAKRNVGDALFPYLKSVSRYVGDVCDAWPVRRRTYDYILDRRASPPFGRYQIILLATEAHVCERLAQGRCHEAQRPGVVPQYLQPDDSKSIILYAVKVLTKFGLAHEQLRQSMLQMHLPRAYTARGQNRINILCPAPAGKRILSPRT